MERNLRIDYFRLILCLLVIPIHTQPLLAEDSLAGWLISNGISRIAVPCFFIISGYLAYTKFDNIKSERKHLLHLFVVYIVWSLIYLPTYYSSVEPRSFITFALFGYYHLWFLPALIVGLLLLFVVRKYIRNTTIILLSGIVLYIAGCIMENLSLPYRSFCNGIFFGYPFIVLGYYIQQKNIHNILKYKYLYPAVFISVMLLFVESYNGYITDFYHNIFLSLYILCPLLLICVLKGAKYKESKNNIAKISAGVYYIHILIITQIITLADSYNITRIPLIIAISILFAIFIVVINKWIKVIL